MKSWIFAIVGAVALGVSACSETGIKSDVAIEAHFNTHRQEFEAIAAKVYEQPEIRRLEVNGAVEPQGIPQARIYAVVVHMDKIGATTVSSETEEGKSVGVLVYKSQWGLTKTLKEIIYFEKPPELPLVEDTDAALNTSKGEVYKKLDTNWYIYASKQG
jgi:hypothetical protein